MFYAEVTLVNAQAC